MGSTRAARIAGYIAAIKLIKTANAMRSPRGTRGLRKLYPRGLLNHVLVHQVISNPIDAPSGKHSGNSAGETDQAGFKKEDSA